MKGNMETENHSDLWSVLEKHRVVDQHGALCWWWLIMSVLLYSITTVALYWLQRFTRLDLESWEEPWNAFLEGKEVKECVERFSNGHRGVSLGLESGTFCLRLEAGTSQPFEEKERFKNGWRWQGQDFCLEVCPVPYCGKGRQAQDWAKSPWSVWVKDRSSC